MSLLRNLRDVVSTVVGGLLDLIVERCVEIRPAEESARG